MLSAPAVGPAGTASAAGSARPKVAAFWLQPLQRLTEARREGPPGLGPLLPRAFPSPGPVLINILRPACSCHAGLTVRVFTALPSAGGEREELTWERQGWSCGRTRARPGS